MSLARFAAAYLGPGSIIFDIGANNGDITLLLSSCAGSSGSVYAFEPNTDCLPALRHSAANAWHKNIYVHCLALSDSTGEVRMMKDTREGSFASTLIQDHADREQVLHSASYTIDTVTATTLDIFCGTSRITPSFLKIDVEGAEEMVINGGKETISRAKPTIWFECWGGRDSGNPINKKLGHFAQLSKDGYSFFIATIFKYDKNWVPKDSGLNPRLLLPLNPRILDTLPILGCDVLAVTRPDLDLLKSHGIVSETSAEEHIFGFFRKKATKTL